MKIVLIISLLFISIGNIFSQLDSLPAVKKEVKPCDCHKQIVEIKLSNDTLIRKLILDSNLFYEKWDELNQVYFWRQLMNLHEDSALLSEKQTRTIVDKVHSSFYEHLGDSAKEYYRDSLRASFGFSDSSRILYSTGKQFFYQFERALPLIDTSISIFIENGVDPWYAQSILLIESPNKIQKSNVGAYGPFQLMKGVAKKYGLNVSGYNDERKDLVRSAYAASQLLKKICIPSARKMLDTLGIPYNECDIWFRLLVMHNYHAGAGNVRAALRVLCPNSGGVDLLKNLWLTEAAGFRNASQNYSQVLLAAQVEFIKMIFSKNPEIFHYYDCVGMRNSENSIKQQDSNLN